jgi:hypothetical protein
LLRACYKAERDGLPVDQVVAELRLIADAFERS